MKTISQHVKEIILRTCISFLCCMAFGYLFFQSNIFSRHTGTFMILTDGFIGSVFFYTLRFNRKDALTVLLILFVMETAFISRVTMPLYLLRNFLHTGSIAIAIYIFFRVFYGKNRNEKWIEPLILAALVTVGALTATLLLTVINNVIHAITFPWIFSMAKLYFLIGLGIGCGITISEDPYRTRIWDWFRTFKP
jgi:hypothetical protein